MFTGFGQNDEYGDGRFRQVISRQVIMKPKSYHRYSDRVLVVYLEGPKDVRCDRCVCVCVCGKKTEFFTKQRQLRAWKR